MKPLKLKQECPTRWSSAYLMVDRLVHVKLAVMAVLEGDQQYEYLNLSPGH